ncbi:MAG: prepilin-type N-terminal cleavage/methylation domain-containing protein [Acidobacteria bacterium]|nr:prepilin-type N-terminal cleavage/methylation domain-containing protein [Acidobacteriota bacterium]
MSLHHRFSTKGQAGFSLPELLVGLVIASMVMMMTYQMFASQAQIASTELRVSNLQMNAQSTLRYLTDQFRNAGYGITTRVPLVPVQFYDSTELTSSSTGPGNSGHGGWTPGDLGLPSDILTGTDIIRILKGTERYTEMMINSYNSPSQNLYLNTPNVFTDNLPDGDYGNAHDPFVGGLMLVYSEDCGSLVVQITQLNSNSANPHGTLVVFNPGWGGDYNSNTGLGCDFTGGSAVFLGDAMDSANTLYVDSRRTLRILTPDSSLPLLDNVLNMQIACGLDTDGNGSVDTWKFKPSSLEKMQLKALRLYLYTVTSVTGIRDSRSVDTIPPDGVDDYKPEENEIDTDVKDSDGNYTGLVRQYLLEINFRNIYPSV